MTDYDDALIEKAAKAIDDEWLHPEHGCAGSHDRCAQECPYPAYRRMGMDELRDTAARAVLDAVADDLRRVWERLYELKPRADRAEAALSRALADVEALADDGGHEGFIPAHCLDALIEKHRDRA